MIKEHMRVVAAHPQIGVPFPGQPQKKLRDQPMKVPKSPYWLRYHEMGIVLDAPAPEVPVEQPPVHASPVTAIATVEE